MTAKTAIHLNGRTIELQPGESVLDALERNGVAMLYSCRTGICQSCLLKALEGPVPPKAQQGLKDSLKAQGYFLSCVCHPTTDLVIAMPGEGLDHHVNVIESADIGAAVRRVRLSIPAGFQWFPGQYLTIIRADNIARSYSIASGPEDGFMELHVRRIPGGAISNWLHDDVRPGDELRIRGAFGDCFYTPGEPDAPLLLAGTGTGLAPLYGILREAVRQGHRGPIQLFHGALAENGLYYRAELQDLARSAGIAYTACVLRPGEVTAPGVAAGSLDDHVLSHSLDTKTTRAYLCGDPELVGKMRKKLFMKGLSNRRIFADAFVPSAPAREG